MDSGYGAGPSYGYGDGAGVMMSRVKETLDHRVWTDDNSPAHGDMPIGEIKKAFSGQRLQQRHPECQPSTQEVRASPIRGQGKVPVYHPSKRTGWTRPESDGSALKDPGWMPAILRGEGQMQGPQGQVFPEKHDQIHVPPPATEQNSEHRPGARRPQNDEKHQQQQQQNQQQQEQFEHHARRDQIRPGRNSDESGHRPTMTPFREPRGRGNISQLPMGHLYETEQERHVDHRKPPWVGSLRSSEKLKAWEVQASESIAPDAADYGDPRQHQAAESTTYTRQQQPQQGTRPSHGETHQAHSPGRQQHQSSLDRYQDHGGSQRDLCQEAYEVPIARHQRSSHEYPEQDQQSMHPEEPQQEHHREVPQDHGSYYEQQPEPVQDQPHAPPQDTSQRYGSYQDLRQDTPYRSHEGPSLAQQDQRGGYDQIANAGTRGPHSPGRMAHYQQPLDVDTEQPMREVHRKYNNPSGLYGAGNLQSPGRHQPQRRQPETGGQRSGQGNITVKQPDGKAYFNTSGSDVYQLLQEEEAQKQRAEQYSARHQEPPPGQEPTYHGYTDPLQKSPTMKALQHYVTDF